MSAQTISVPLKMACPGNKCEKEKYLGWTHSNCGGTLHMTSEVDLFCDYHEAATKSFIKHWGFRCSDATHGGDHYVGLTKNTLGSALSHVAQTFGDTLENEVMLKISNAMFKRWDKC